MTNVLDTRGTERAFRTAISTIAAAKGHVTKLVDSDRTTADLINRLDEVVVELQADREAFRDWLRE